jgi:probable F420-dependent oxidoreductase
VGHDRRFRFGVQVSTAESGAAWAGVARRTEALGYSTLFLPDHFEDQLAPVPAMMAAATATTELKVGALVLGNDYRHPVVLAKELATVDVLSEGRLEIGLGAGWMNTDYEKAGIPQDSPGVRIDRLAESIAVIKGLFGDGPLEFDGSHYQVHGLEGTPKPEQHPSPPWIVGGGGRRMLALAAREADIIGINPSLHSGDVDAEAARDATAEATERKLGWLRETAGDRFDDIELNCLCLVVAVTDDRDGFAQAMAGGFGISPEEALEVPHALVGTVDQICDTLKARRDRFGFSYIVIQGDALDAMAPVVERLAGT